MQGISQYDLVSEPKNGEYSTLLEIGGRICERFSLVQQPQFKFNADAYKCLESLKPYLIVERQTSEWPGTQLLDRTACVREYRVTRDSIWRLMETTQGL
jgi:hypothetical protein